MTGRTPLETRSPSSGSAGPGGSEVWFENVLHAGRLQRWTTGALTALLGTCLVVGTLLVVNNWSRTPDQNNAATDTSFAVVRKPPPSPPPRPETKPPERRQTTAPTPPLLDLDMNLSGIDFGLEALSVGDLQSLDDRLLGQTGDVVMTDDTVDQPPRPAHQAPLEYPDDARARGVEGYVLLSLLINTSGEVEKAQVLEASPAGLFEQSALTGVRLWRFEPARYQGRTVKVWARLKVRFDLS